jgi:hypothetical protein
MANVRSSHPRDARRVVGKRARGRVGNVRLNYSSMGKDSLAECGTFARVTFGHGWGRGNKGAHTV